MAGSIPYPIQGRLVRIAPGNMKTTDYSQATFVSVPTNPSVCPLRTSSPIPNAPRARGLVDVIHRDRGDLGLPAG